MGWLRTRFIAYGFLLGTAGVKILTSREAKKLYTKTAALGMRCADDVLQTVQELRENCEDIIEDARVINDEYYREEEERLIADAKAVLENCSEKE